MTTKDGLSRHPCKLGGGLGLARPAHVLLATVTVEDALQAVKNNGQHVEVALLGQNTSQRLRDVADRVIDLDQGRLAHCWRTA